jgi:hypothetical protein
MGMMGTTLQDLSDARELGPLGDDAWQVEPFMNVATESIPTVADPIPTEIPPSSTEPPSYDDIRPILVGSARIEVEEAFLAMQLKADADLL